MNGRSGGSWRQRLSLAGLAAALAFGGLTLMMTPADAQFFFGWPHYYPPPAYYPPPPYYPPPAYYPASPAYYPAPEPAAAPAPGGPLPGGVGPAPGAVPPSAGPEAATASITYTKKPAFKNAAGHPCREYTTTPPGGSAHYGTACRDASGQWRVVN